MTVARLVSELTYNEFVDWLAFYDMQNKGPQPQSLDGATPDDIKAALRL